jgi:hypothetical protein
LISTILNKFFFKNQLKSNGFLLTFLTKERFFN